MESIQKYIEKAAHLIEALPYIRQFYGKTFVIKCGGAAMTDEKQVQNIMQDIAALHFCGIRIVVVHGGGPDISSWCDRLQIPTQFYEGQRYTDAATMEVVQMVLTGKNNKTLVMALNQYGVKAVGLSGQDGGFITATKKMAANDLGYVGSVVKVEAMLINTLLNSNFLPIVAPVCADEEGQAYNVNADHVAAALAQALVAEKMIFLSDVNGFYADRNNPATRINQISKEIVKEWLVEKQVSSGMIPKLQSCVDVLEHGVKSAHILDGRMPHSLLLEIFTHQGVGTLVY